MDDQWYWSRGGRTNGPLIRAELASLIERGDLTSTDLIWSKGMTAWRPVADFAVLASEDTLATAAAVPEAVQPPLTPTPGAHPGRANYFVRHWRGECSLAVSYWLNGVLGQALAFALVAALAATLTNLHVNQGWALYWCVAWSVVAAGAVWQTVGIWRSASRHIANTGRTFWPRAAQVAVVLGLARVLAEFINVGVPAIRSGFEHARWLERNAKWQFRILRQGTEMEVSGGVGFGFTDDFRRFLDAAPTVQLVHLNLAMGGLVQEAKDAGALIRSRGLSTYTSGVCASACTLIFLGGKNRFMKTGAKLGFHSPGLPGISRANMREKLAEEERYLTSLGVSPPFAKKAMGTPTETMWYPTAEELTAAAVVTRVTSGEDFGISGYGTTFSVDSLDQALQTNRLFRALKKAHPEAYQDVLRAELSAFEKGKSSDQLRDETLPLVSPLISASLQYSSDDALLRLGRLMVKQLDILSHVQGDTCVGYLNGEATAANAALRSLPVELREEELETQADILESVDRNRRAPSKAAFDSRLAIALARAQQSVGEDVLLVARLNDSSVSSSRRCRGALGLYSAIMSLPRKDAALVLRGMMTN